MGDFDGDGVSDLNILITHAGQTGSVGAMMTSSGNLADQHSALSYTLQATETNTEPISGPQHDLLQDGASDRLDVTAAKASGPATAVVDGSSSPAPATLPDATSVATGSSRREQPPRAASRRVAADGAPDVLSQARRAARVADRARSTGAAAERKTSVAEAAALRSARRLTRPNRPAAVDDVLADVLGQRMVW